MQRGTSILGLIMWMIGLTLLISILSGTIIYLLPYIILIGLGFFIYNYVRAYLFSKKTQSRYTRNTQTNQQQRQNTTTVNPTDSIDVEYTILDEDEINRG